MARIVSVQTAFPRHQYPQREVIQLLQKVWPDQAQVLERLEKTSGVEKRNFSVPIERYQKLSGFSERNGLYIEEMLSALEKSVSLLQEKTGFDWKDLAIVVSNTITGVAVPSLDARLMNRLPIPRNVQRTPIFGLGCMGGVSSLNRANDFLFTAPGKLALVIAAEACSLTFQLGDASMANLVATCLFGDGAAAVLLAGEKHPLAKTAPVKISGGVSSFYPETERVMGWDMVDTGFKIVLSGSVPEIVRQFVKKDVDGFLSNHHTSLEEINSLISHPGGPKVLTALAEELKKDASLFRHSWESLRDQGNLSSVSVLNVLERHLEQKTLRPGYALAIAMGPAFNSELSLMEVRG